MKNHNNKKSHSNPGKKHDKNKPGGSFAQRHSHNPNNVLVNRNGLNPFPSRYRTQQTAIISGAIPASSTDNVLRCRAGPFLPFNGGLWPGVLTASTASLDFVGFQNLCSITGPYLKWVCYGMKCRITMMPTAVADTIGVSLGFQDVGVSVPSGYADSAAEPFYESMLVQTGATTKTLRNQCTIAELAGFNNDNQVKVTDNLQGTYTSNPGTTFGCFVTWACLNSALNTAIIPYEFEVTIDVEYFNEVGGGLLDLANHPRTMPGNTSGTHQGVHNHVVDGSSLEFGRDCYICCTPQNSPVLGPRSGPSR